MQNKKVYTLDSILKITGGTFRGKDKNIIINGVKPVNKASLHDITIFDDLSYKHFLNDIKPALIIVKKDYEEYISGPCIIHENPRSILPELLKLFQNKPVYKGISDRSFISPSAELGSNTAIEPFAVIMDNSVIGDNVFIGSHVYIGENVIIGDNTIIYPGVKIHYNSKIGRDTIIQSNSVIGGDGYGYYTGADGEHRKIPQIGSTILEDDVEIGSNVSIDRGTIGDTLIKRGTKIDNLVQIAHNVTIGKNCLIVSQVGISGSVNIGDFVVIAGQAGIADHIDIPPYTKIGGRSAVIGTIRESGDYSGFPLLPINDFLRNMSVQKNLYNLYRDINKIKKQLKI